MYYVIFHYTKGRMGLGVQGCRLEADVIKFLHDQHEEIDVHRIIEACAEYQLGLIVTEDYVKSALELKEGVESLVELGKKPEEIIKQNKKTLEELEDGEASAISKIADDIEKEQEEEELTPEQKAKKAMDDADELIEREKKRKEQEKKGWKLCTQCKKHHIAPWNKKRICSICQNERKTTRPYTRSKEFPGL